MSKGMTRRKFMSALVMGFATLQLPGFVKGSFARLAGNATIPSWRGPYPTLGEAKRHSGMLLPELEAIVRAEEGYWLRRFCEIKEGDMVYFTDSILDYPYTATSAPYVSEEDSHREGREVWAFEAKPHWWQEELKG